MYWNRSETIRFNCLRMFVRRYHVMRNDSNHSLYCFKTVLKHWRHVRIHIMSSIRYSWTRIRTHILWTPRTNIDQTAFSLVHSVIYKRVLTTPLRPSRSFCSHDTSILIKLWRHNQLSEWRNDEARVQTYSFCCEAKISASWFWFGAQIGIKFNHVL